MSVSYRKAVLADLGAVGALGDEVNLLHHVALPGVFAMPASSHRDAAMWEEAILAERSAVFVAERDRSIVGFITGQVEDESATQFVPVRFCRVGTLAVTEAERGQGIGRALVASLEAWAATHLAVEVHLNVWTFNAKAARLYQELGYEVRAQFMVKRLGQNAA